MFPGPSNPTSSLISEERSITERAPGSGTQTPRRTSTLEHIKIVAPLKGRVSVKVSEGGLVKAGEVIVVQISAKTELEVKAPKAGYIRNLVADGENVEENDQIAELEVSS